MKLQSITSDSRRIRGRERQVEWKPERTPAARYRRVRHQHLTEGCREGRFRNTQ